ncbi:mycothione reductase [Streptoalloteichus tenebrarius]|uniref:Mycothione reductase n=1 Tax=Streptoalloteichus tenebrarius (strain ATCC 17920 / DSM 40477 / JCM 4838 / CBS 697.72 / NBRC 16177 / NCIMB 11028 / NRRL B-12390 / A12253. 1 / ISP 5477) TaxID=1933 RepID=A0ABT1HZ07_STRSD|nr:mycothione reductase [Streptoalloteichus tenebrarius]MCP2260766.1 mycothione reductase [Streptoalloteichus tenebrarius]BFF03420.1 mycothione reductase [Streptoalloteichus tenebrarius]
MRHFDLVIIGTGSGNSILDPRFDDWNVAIVEKGVFGGTCLNVGCIPTKMFVHTADLANAPAAGARLGVDARLTGVRWPEVRDRIFGRIDPIAEGGRRYRAEECANVTVYAGEGRFVGSKRLAVSTGSGEDEVITADRFVLAAGSRPIVPDVVGIEQVGFHTNEDVMRLAELPRRMVILGSGFVATEFAHVFGSFGVDVTLVARSDLLLRGQDLDVATRFTELAERRWDVRRNRKAVRAERDGDVTRLHLEGPDGAEVVEGEALLVAVGRRPNSDLLNLGATGVTTHPDGRVVVDCHQRTEVDGIYALGDLSSPYQLKHVANHEARVVQHNLLHPDAPVSTDHRFVPHAVFSSPQVASVGLTEQQARARGVRYVTATQQYAGIAYGWAMEDTTGFCKLLADPADGRLLGAHIIGPQAPTLIQPLVQAMHFGLDARSMARGQYWIHPSMPELVENALLNLPLDD